MARDRVRDGVGRAARLIPFDAGTLRGDGVWVLTPAATVPERFAELQRARSEAYLSTGDRSAPLDALRYVVTYCGEPIAWITLDGVTHTAADGEISSPVARRHRDAMAAALPERFRMRDGEIIGLPDDDTVTRQDLRRALQSAGLSTDLVTLGGGVLGLSVAHRADRDGQCVIVTIDQGMAQGTVGLSSLEIACNYPPEIDRPDEAPYAEMILPRDLSAVVDAVGEMARRLGLI